MRPALLARGECEARRRGRAAHSGGGAQLAFGHGRRPSGLRCAPAPARKLGQAGPTGGQGVSRQKSNRARDLMLAAAEAVRRDYTIGRFALVAYYLVLNNQQHLKGGQVLARTREPRKRRSGRLSAPVAGTANKGRTAVHTYPRAGRATYLVVPEIEVPRRKLDLQWKGL